ncbi:MAG: hypothetical protein AAF636_26020 [Pseudomonadota bacterium]
MSYKWRLYYEAPLIDVQGVVKKILYVTGNRANVITRRSQLYSRRFLRKEIAVRNALFITAGVILMPSFPLLMLCIYWFLGGLVWHWEVLAILAWCLSFFFVIEGLFFELMGICFNQQSIKRKCQVHSKFYISLSASLALYGFCSPGATSLSTASGGSLGLADSFAMYLSMAINALTFGAPNAIFGTLHGVAIDSFWKSLGALYLNILVILTAVFFVKDIVVERLLCPPARYVGDVGEIVRKVACKSGPRTLVLDGPAETVDNAICYLELGDEIGDSIWLLNPQNEIVQLVRTVEDNGSLAIASRIRSRKPPKVFDERIEDVQTKELFRPSHESFRAMSARSRILVSAIAILLVTASWCILDISFVSCILAVPIIAIYPMQIYGNLCSKRPLFKRYKQP